MLTEYIHAAMKRAQYQLADGGDAFTGSIPEFPGVTATASTLEACREELREALERWLLGAVKRGASIPEVDGWIIRVDDD